MAASLKQQAYDFIRNKLADGRLDPGTRLSNRGIARDIGISFIPVREAIAQLASEGLVDHRPGIGTFVASPTADDFREIFELRIAIETYALRTAFDKLTHPIRLEQFQSAHQAFSNIVDRIASSDMDNVPRYLTQQLAELDHEFHTLILNATENVRLKRVVDGIRASVLNYGSKWSRDDLSRFRQTVAEHAAIVAAIEANDLEHALNSLTIHLDQGCRNLTDSHRKRIDHSLESRFSEIHS